MPFSSGKRAMFLFPYPLSSIKNYLVALFIALRIATHYNIKKLSYQSIDTLSRKNAEISEKV